MKKKIAILLSALVLIIGMFSVSFIMAGATTPEPELSIPYCNLSFRDSVCIKYAVKSNVSDVKILIWTSPEKEYTVGTHDAEITKYYEEDIYGETHKIFDYTELAAKQMADVVYARAYSAVGGAAYYSEVNKYSILQYAYNMLGKTSAASEDEELKEMLTNMLAYGASAQKYLNDYKVDRLATADWYQVLLTAGTLDDGCNHGLYLPGDMVTMTASEKDADGASFSHWKDSKGNKISTSATYELIVGEANEVYTPVYIKYSTGLEFDSNGDETCYIIGKGDCTDTDIIIPPVSPDGDVVIGIDSSAFAGEAITSISFPCTIEEIGRRAFNNCSSLTDVYYDGTEEEWNEKVSISSGNDAIENAIKHFNNHIVESFTVKFVDYDGTELKTETVEKGKSATAPADPIREGYAFVGWDKEFNNIASDLTVTAEYEEISNPAIVVNSAIANAGDQTVTVTISLLNNPGISSLKFDVEYDNILTLQTVTFDSAYGAYVTAPTPYDNPQTITFISPLVEVDTSGTFATLTFNISEAVTTDTIANITITVYQEDTYDENFDEVSLEIINGTVNIRTI